MARREALSAGLPCGGEYREEDPRMALWRLEATVNRPVVDNPVRDNTLTPGELAAVLAALTAARKVAEGEDRWTLLGAMIKLGAIE
jgi:hypothetical protein